MKTRRLKALVDKVKERELSLDESLALSLEDVKQGRVSPSFSSGEELIDYLRSHRI